MTGLIRMLPDDVRGMAHQVDLTAGDLYNKPGSIRSLATSLQSNWQGGKAARYADKLRQLAGRLQRETINLQRLANRVGNEVIEWEETDNTFKVGDLIKPITMGLGLGAGVTESGSIAVSIIARKIANGEKPDLQDFARRIDEMYPHSPKNLGEVLMPDYTPVCVYKTGSNKYTVLIVGTVGGIDINNWESARDIGLGTETEYTEQVRSIIKKLGKGSEVTLIGHSQGGMVADQMAADKSLRDDGINVNHVVSLGGPQVAKAQEGVKYERYTAGDDFVPGLSTYAFGDRYYNSEAVDGEGGGLSDHGSYGSSYMMDGKPVDGLSEFNQDSGGPATCYPPVRKSARYFLRKGIEVFVDRRNELPDLVPDIFNVIGIGERSKSFVETKISELNNGAARGKLITSRMIVSPRLSSSW